jgi:hypothetical protein
MSDDEGDATKARDGLHGAIATELRVRRSELVQAIRTHIQEILPQPAEGGAEYQAGAFAAVAAILDHCLDAIEAIEYGVSRPGPSLTETTVQRAAGVSMSFATQEAAAGRTRQDHETVGELPTREPPGSVKVTGHADRPLLAAALESESLQASLREFLAPLRRRPDGGAVLLRTLRAYLDAECNSSSAASALKVRRQTVGNRLRLAEQLLGRPLRSCLGELDVALRLAVLASDDSQCRRAGLFETSCM